MRILVVYSRMLAWAKVIVGELERVDLQDLFWEWSGQDLPMDGTRNRLLAGATAQMRLLLLWLSTSYFPSVREN